jgi:hypothetical protein
MQFHITYIKRVSLLFFGLAFVFSGCLKKIDEVDQLDTNVYDRGYAGDQWFEILDYYQFINDLGQTRVRVEYNIPEENLPELKSSFFDLALRKGEVTTWSYITLPLNGDGGYNFYTDFVKNDADVYCLSLGVYVPDEDAVINDFQECVSL